MKNGLIFIAGLAIGAAAGCLASRAYFKDKYAKEAQANINALIEDFRRKKENAAAEVNAEESKSEEPEPASSEEDKAAYKQLVANLYGKINESDDHDVFKPYVISPEEFGMKDGYDTVSLTYFSDHVVGDDRDRPLSDADIDAIIGRESLSCFGMHEDDCVHVRNDRTKCDYEILMDPRTYDEVLDEKPYIKREL